jgi:hypothetical protein
MRMKDLDCYVAFKTGLVRFVDIGHATSSEAVGELILAERMAYKV